MLIRKINAGLSLLITFLLMDHAVFYSVWMLSRGSIEKSASFMPWILMGLTVIHAFIGIDLAVTGIMEAAKHKDKNYPKMNASTLVQRISGILLLLFVPLHVAGAAGFMHPPKIVQATVPLGFFTIALAHVAVSASKALITLGIGSAKFIKAVDIVVKIICAATLIAAITGFCLYKV